MTIYTPKDYLISNNVVTSKGKVNTQLQRRSCFKPHVDYIKSVCPFEGHIIEQVFYLYYEFTERPKCHVCTNPSSFLGFTKGYTKYCSPECYRSNLHNYTYGVMTKDSEKRKVMNAKGVSARQKNGSYNFSDEHKESLSRSAKESMHKKRSTCRKKYGVENPGVMGGHSSKAAKNYIRDFISQRNIDLDCCFFHDDELGKREFFQMVSIPGTHKKKYFQYDLVVFRSAECAKRGNVNDVILVLEYNGPWHYTLRETLIDPHSPSTPYRATTNDSTKMLSFIHDKMKRKHFSHVHDYYTFWERDSSLRKGSVFI
jgi:hypothetical protein